MYDCGRKSSVAKFIHFFLYWRTKCWKSGQMPRRCTRLQWWTRDCVTSFGRQSRNDERHPCGIGPHGISEVPLRGVSRMPPFCPGVHLLTGSRHWKV